MAEIALALNQALERRQLRGEGGCAASRVLAHGNGWTVADVVCTSGPRDRPFEERHGQYSVAIVLIGTFQYRTQAGNALMTPGSLMLGNPGQTFECGHEHAEGDRCVSFWYNADFFERLRSDAGHRGRPAFEIGRVPPVRSIAALVAAAGTNLLVPGRVSWEELGVRLAACAAGLASGTSPCYRAPLDAEARVTRTIRSIERQPEAPLTLDSMAREAGVSPYHFLRTFERVTGVTPHQFVVRSRLREAAMQVSARPGKILDVALDSGFGDISNFNRAFRTEFGLSPRGYRRRPV